MGKVLPLAAEADGDWYETISRTQEDNVELNDTDRQLFNKAFESFSAGQYSRAYAGFRRLARKDSCLSQYFLGVMHLSGEGVLQDFLRAHMWFNIASSHGHKKAHEHLKKLTTEIGPKQVGEAQKMARHWVERNSKRSGKSST